MFKVLFSPPNLLFRVPRDYTAKEINHKLPATLHPPEEPEVPHSWGEIPSHPNKDTRKNPRLFDTQKAENDMRHILFRTPTEDAGIPANRFPVPAPGETS